MKQYPKIEIFFLVNEEKKIWEYYSTTKRSKTCKEAKQKFLKRHNYLRPDNIKCKFKKGAQ